MPRRSLLSHIRMSSTIALLLAPSLSHADHHLQVEPSSSIDVGKRPESVTRGFDDDLFVTVMNGKESGDGVVKRIHDGKVTVFATGMDEPKGIAFVGGFLITSDLQRVWKIDARGNAKVIAQAKDFPEPIVYLNDVAAAPDGGGVYIADMGDRGDLWSSPGKLWPLDSDQAKQIKVVGRIYHMTLSGKVSLVQKPSPQMLCPNGVGVGRNGQLLVAAFFTGNLLESRDNEVRIVASGCRGADGVAQDQAGNYYVSSWNQGKVWKISPEGEKQVLIEGLKSAADFYLDPSAGKLYVPDMLAGKIYTFSL